MALASFSAPRRCGATSLIARLSWPIHLASRAHQAVSRRTPDGVAAEVAATTLAPAVAPVLEASQVSEAAAAVVPSRIPAAWAAAATSPSCGMTGRFKMSNASIHPALAPTNVERMLRIQINAATGCWLWHGPLNHGGYGSVCIGGKSHLAHRVLYELYVGSIPQCFTLDHLCRVRNCVNPNHLQAVTSAENTLRNFSPPSINARKTHCSHGHEFTKDNTYRRNGDGYRQCRICNNASAKKWRTENPDKADAAARNWRKRNPGRKR